MTSPTASRGYTPVRRWAEEEEAKARRGEQQDRMNDTLDKGKDKLNERKEQVTNGSVPAPKWWPTETVRLGHTPPDDDSHHEIHDYLGLLMAALFSHERHGPGRGPLRPHQPRPFESMPARNTIL